MLIKAIFFDAFGTLCKIRSKKNTYLPIIKAWPTGVAGAYQALMTRDCAPVQLALEVGCPAHTIKEIDEGVAAEIASMCLYPEVLEVLGRLCQNGVKWAVVSNLAKPYAEPLLQLLPFAPDFCAWSFAVGHKKPEEGIYRYALNALDIEPSSVLMVGDSMENDFNTPKRLGMQARYLNRAGTKSGEPEVVSDLTGILTLELYQKSI